MALTVAHVGTLTENYAYAAFAPDGSGLYVWENNRGNDLRSYTYPGLVEGSIVVADVPGPVAVDADGEIYWISDAGGVAQLLTNPASPTVLETWTENMGLSALCWSPYDGHLYLVLETSQGTETGLWRITTAGVATHLLAGANYRITSAGDGIVPTLDGGLWWRRTSSTIHRYDIPAATVAEASIALGISASMIPQPDNTVLAYGTRLGTTQGWRIDSTLSFTSEPLANHANGWRAVAYTPDLMLVTAERRITGEVWEFANAVSGGWRVGSVGFG